METSRKLQKQTKDGTLSVTLPKIFAKSLGLKAGDTVQFVLKNGYIKLLKEQNQ